MMTDGDAALKILLPFGRHLVARHKKLAAELPKNEARFYEVQALLTILAEHLRHGTQHLRSAMTQKDSPLWRLRVRVDQAIPSQAQFPLGV